jgi:hypothetical protein
MAWWRSRHKPAVPESPSPAVEPSTQPRHFRIELDERLAVRGAAGQYFEIGPLEGSLSATLHFVSPSRDGTDVIRTVFTTTSHDGQPLEHVTDNLPDAFFKWLVEEQGALLPTQADGAWLGALRESMLIRGAKTMLDDRIFHSVVINSVAREVKTHYLAFSLDLALLDDDFSWIVARMTGLSDTEGDMLPPLLFAVPMEEFIRWHTAEYSEEDEAWVERDSTLS